jgi:hypothetical protein
MKSILVLGVILTAQLAMLVCLKNLSSQIQHIGKALDDVQQRECIQILLQLPTGDKVDITPHPGKEEKSSTDSHINM